MAKTTEIPLKECSAYGQIDQGGGGEREETDIYEYPQWLRSTLILYTNMLIVLNPLLCTPLWHWIQFLGSYMWLSSYC